MNIGSILIMVGVLLIVFGLFYSIVGKLPGDIVIEKENFKFYFPITTSILLSIILTLVLMFVAKL